MEIGGHEATERIDEPVDLFRAGLGDPELERISPRGGGLDNHQSGSIDEPTGAGIRKARPVRPSAHPEAGKPLGKVTDPIEPRRHEKRADLINESPLTTFGRYEAFREATDIVVLRPDEEAAVPADEASGAAHADCRSAVRAERSHQGKSRRNADHSCAIDIPAQAVAARERSGSGGKVADRCSRRIERFLRS